MKFNFKKIVALGVSVLMTVSGIGFAAAANYPAPFVSGGVANVAIVYGTGTGVSALDLVEASNIQSNLQTFMTGTTGGTTSNLEGGKGVIIKKSSDNLNLGDKMSDLKSTLDYEDLPTLLAKGTYIASDNDEFKYEQKITLGNGVLTHFQDSDYEDLINVETKTPVVGFKINSSEFVLNYTIDFTTDAESDIVSSDLDDIEGSDIPILGKKYYVSNLDMASGTSGYLGELTLLDSAEVGNVAEGESTTVAGHEVSINWIDNDEVIYTVDGVRVPSTGKLKKGDSAKISDGSYLGVRDISKLEVSGEVGTTSFSIGTGKIVMTSGSEIKLNDESVHGIRGYVYNGTGGTSTVQKVDKIVIEWKADDETFLTPEHEVNVPGFGGLKFTMNKFVRPTEEKITVAKDTDTSIKVTMPLKDGEVGFNLLYANATGDFIGIGKDATNLLATSGNNSLKYYEKHSGADYHREFFATYNTTTQAESYLLRAKVSEDTTNARNETTIEKKTPSGWVTVCEEKKAGDDCTIGNVVLTIVDVNYKSGGNESVTFSAGSKVSFHTAFTAGGLMIYLPYYVNGSGSPAAGAINVTQTTQWGLNDVWGNESIAGQGYNTYYVNFDGEDKDDTIAAGNAFNLTLDDTSNNRLEVSQINGAGSGGAHGLEVGTSSQIYEAYIAGDVAPRTVHYTKPDEDWAEVYYASGNSESYAEVYVAEQSATVSSTTTASGTTSLGEVLVKDSEVSSVSTKNLIVVGGSCINSAAANLVGGAKCGADFTTATGIGSGQYLIKSYTGKYSTGKIALLVAGYDVADTVNAAKYLRTQTVDTSKSYKGTTATTAEVVTEAA